VTLVTYHPTTLGDLSVEEESSALFEALEELDGTLIFSSPNADAQGALILRRIRAFVEDRPHTVFFDNLGQLLYYSLLAHADLMVGNSSSGIWEAPSFKLPVVNIGDRQKGRLKPPNVIDAEPRRTSIVDGLVKGLSESFRQNLSGITNPYGDGFASPRIVSVLKTVDLSDGILKKRFISRSG
jgi:GDP/UDP-N,N'-diacetylbacillosamine 2-epimerase (hydrolysing)